MKLRVDDNKVIEEAQKRFTFGRDANSTAYNRWEDDWKFGHGDSLNLWQWPEGLPQTRMRDDQISLTINKTKQHCMNIVNSLCAAETSINYTAVAAGATDDAAEAWSGLGRYIEYRSNARGVYRNAVTHMVFGGLGYWRIVTEAADPTARDADIFLRQVADPTRVYLDPDAKEPDGSDARWAFVYDQMPIDKFKEEYPDDADDVGSNDIFGGIFRGGAKDKESVGIVEYFRRVTKRERIWFLDDGQVIHSPDLTPEIREGLKNEGVESRMVDRHEIQYFKICGQTILEKYVWPGQYIPIVPIYGEVTDVDGVIDRVGHVRCMRDAQMMLNYNRSAQTMAVALQTKVPWLTPIEATSGLETYWENANRQNFAYLPYNGFDDDGRPLAPPQRLAAAMPPDAYIAGVEGAAQDLMMVSGQFEASMGQQGNERSGVALQSRQSANEVSAQHYQASFEQALRFTGKIIMDLAPSVYTTEKVIAILGQDGKQTQVKVDPNAAQSYQESEDKTENEAVAIFNPNVGKFEVRADIGPGFLTQRQQAFEALQTVIKASPEWSAILGDLLMKNAPFPEASDMAERLYRMVPQQALGGPNPEVLQLQQEVQRLQGALAGAMQQLGKERASKDLEADQKTIDAYRAETDRMSALSKIDQNALAPIVHQLVAQALQTIMPLTQNQVAQPSINQQPQTNQSQMQLQSGMSDA